VLDLTYTLLAAETVSIDCGIGKKTVQFTNTLGTTNITGYLSSASEFWGFIPGTNAISFGMTGTTINSTIITSFYDQYLGV
jgi:hypothetical protein